MLSLIDQAMNAVGGASASAGIIAIVLETVLRLIPSQKPLSILYMISDGVKVGAQACSKLGDLLSAVGALSDKILPQRLK